MNSASHPEGSPGPDTSPEMTRARALSEATTLKVITSHESALSELAASISKPSLTEEYEEEASFAETPDVEEQALGVEEVVELQAYDERRWIAEQIQILGSLPSFDIFASLELIRTHHYPLPGLPNRQELETWVTQHDTIDKQADTLERGKLRKLKKITTAVSHRSLSRQDTDLIEMALETIFEFDKLRRLLRNRTDDLGLLGARLTWEEKRTSSWTTLSTIWEDIHTFTKHARWSPATYDDLPLTMHHSSSETVLSRRDSTASLASFASDTSLTTNTPNRAARFKLGESFTKDAARFSSRFNALRSGDVVGADKALRKLMDKKQVPDPILDEQDLLELKGLTEVENVGKFLMTLAMQWKKADEYYGDILKDQTAARALADDLESAMLSHPTSRLASGFASKIAALHKRSSTRSDPSRAFLRPSHAMFPDQASHNDAVVASLVQERTVMSDLVAKVQSRVEEYQQRCDVVNRVDKLVQRAEELCDGLTSVAQRMKDGFSGDEDNDGSPPDLSTSACLDKSRHAAYLALLPSMSPEPDALVRESEELCNTANGELSNLADEGVSLQYREDAARMLRRLLELTRQVSSTHRAALDDIASLRQVRRIWDTVEHEVQTLESVRHDIAESIRKEQWKRHTPEYIAPPTPDSVADSLLDYTPPSSTAGQALDECESRSQNAIIMPARSLSSQVGSPLRSLLLDSGQTLLRWASMLRTMEQDLDHVRDQASVMTKLKEEVDALELRMEDTASQLQIAFTATIAGTPVIVSVDDVGNDFHKLSENLHSRVPLISRGHRSSRTNGTHGLTMDALRQNLTIEPPVDLSLLDDAVRTDANVYLMRLGGLWREVQERHQHLDLARSAQEVEVLVKDIDSSIQEAVAKLSARSIDTLGMENLDELKAVVAQLAVQAQATKTRIGRSFSPVRALIHRMEQNPVRDAQVREATISLQTRTLDHLETAFRSWQDDISGLQDSISSRVGIEEQRLAAEQTARLLAEEAERQALAAEQLRQQREAEVEAARLVVEEAEREALIADQLRQQRAIEAEASRCAAKAIEQARLATEEAERAALAAELLRQQQAEATRLAAEESEQARLAAEESEREALAAELVRQQQADADANAARLVADKLEQARLVAEEVERERLAADELRQQREAEAARATEEAKQARRVSEEAKQEALTAEHIRRQQEGEAARLAAEAIEEARIASEKGQLELLLAAERADKEAAVATEEARTHDDEATLSRRMTGMEVQTPIGAKTLPTVEEEADDKPHSLPSVEDVFGLKVSLVKDLMTPELLQLQATIAALRSRLNSLNLPNATANRSQQAFSVLPSQADCDEKRIKLDAVLSDAAMLPSSVPYPAVQSTLRSLSMDLKSSQTAMTYFKKLSGLSLNLRACEALLSDLLEHIDSFPSLPMGSTLSSYLSPLDVPPEEQLSLRLSDLETRLKSAELAYLPVADHQTAASEYQRVQQTWSELRDMALDRIGGTRSRPVSALSSISRQSPTPSVAMEPSEFGELPSPLPRVSKKAGGYAKLSASVSKRGGLLTPGPATASSRRSTSGSAPVPQRSLSRQSITSTTRSVSGPLPGTPSSRILQSTFSSRQRTNSTTSNGTSTPVGRTGTPQRSRAQTNEMDRVVSPSLSQMSSRSRSNSTMNPTRSSTSHSYHSPGQSARGRASRTSSIIAPKAGPSKTLVPKRKTYVANPKYKLDVAVAETVNKLSVNIEVVVAEDTWKDQSGKYWIGTQDPKLCFCRILRSQTVMVRVGGGWTELSKFIKEHFADQFRLLPEALPRHQSIVDGQDKWINSTALKEASASPPRSVKTPEPAPHLPLFALSTPSNKAIRSAQSTPHSRSPGSPLTALQFMRRAEMVASANGRPTTPTKNPVSKVKTGAPRTPALSTWRP